jgi:hypothetical protein
LGSSSPFWALSSSPLVENTIRRKVTKMVIMSTNGVRLSAMFDERTVLPAPPLARCLNGTER